MRVFVNALPLKDAGGKSVVSHFVQALSTVGRGHEFEVVVPTVEHHRGQFECSNVRMHSIPDALQAAALRLAVDRWVIAPMIRNADADVIFSMGNIAVPVHGIPQLVLFHWPYAVYPESAVWARMDVVSRQTRRARLNAFRRRLPYATVVAAQTETAKRRLERLYDLSNVVVVPNAVSMPPSNVGSAGSGIVLPRQEGEIWLLCLSRYYPHKNLESLLAVARAIRATGARYRIVITIDAAQHRGARQLLRSITAERLQDTIVNVGAVPMADVPALYQQVDALLLPTLLESFSGTYVDAMHHGVPVFTSDCDFARDVCGPAAFYFDPMSDDSILACIDNAFRDPQVMQAHVQMGRTRVASMPDWTTVARMYVELLADLAVRSVRKGV